MRPSSLITRMTTDVTVLQNAVINGMRPMVRGPVMLVMGLLLAFFMNVRLALVFLGVHAGSGMHPVFHHPQNRSHVRPAPDRG